MKLRDIEIRGFKSLADVRLGRIGSFNAFVGRNNCGKSAALQVFRDLAARMAGSSFGSPMRNITDGQIGGRIQLTIEFDLDPSERMKFIALIKAANPSHGYLGILEDSPFGRSVRYNLTTVPDHPEIVHVGETS